MSIFGQAAAWDALKNGEPIPIEAKRKTHPTKTWQPKRPPKPGQKPKGDGEK